MIPKRNLVLALLKNAVPLKPAGPPGVFELDRIRASLISGLDGLHSVIEIANHKIALEYTSVIVV